MTSRRAFLLGTASLVAAPAIVRISSLMPVKAPLPASTLAFVEADGILVYRGSYGVTMAMIRDQLLPGLLENEANYRDITSHWNHIFMEQS
jgi:hypothetical protein